MLLLEGEYQDAVLELDSGTISEKEDVDRIIARLNKIYKNELIQKIMPYNGLKV